jgi:hypothetical protein
VPSTQPDGQSDSRGMCPDAGGFWVDDLVKVLSGKLLDKPTSAASVGRHFFVWLDRTASGRRPRRPNRRERGLTVRSTRTAAAVIPQSPPPASRRRGTVARRPPPTHSVHGGSRPSVTLPRRKSSSWVGAAGVWRARAGSAAKTNRQHRTGRTAWVTSNGMNRPALLCATNSTNWPWSRRLIAALTAFTTRGQKGGSASATSKKRRDHAFVLPHSECISDGSPRQGIDRRAVHQDEHGPIAPLFYRGLGSADALRARRTTGRIER